jgi:hypothetical protein
VGIPNRCTVDETRHRLVSWRTYYIKTSEDTEQRIIIQMCSIQYPQIDQYCCDVSWFLLGQGYYLMIIREDAINYAYKRSLAILSSRSKVTHISKLEFRNKY